MTILALKGWERFQHYKDRDPPWVKLYRDLLTSESWVLGTDTSRLVQVASILLAARYGNRIPYRWDLIRKVASLECTEKAFSDAVRHLSSNGFLEIQDVTDDMTPSVQPASDVLATCSSETEQSRAEQRQSRKGAARAPLVLHESLPTEEWEQWLELRRKRRWPCDDVTLGKQLRELAQHDTPTQCEMINRSINAGWQGIFPPKGRVNGVNGSAPVLTWRPPPDEDEHASA